VIIFGKRVAGLSEAALARFVTRAARSAGVQGDVSVLVAGSDVLRKLNRRFRKKDRATDVLSFPPMPGLGDGFAGDVAISADIAAQNAKRLSHSAAEEVKILALHGVLHLAGYDHERDNGTMARREERMRRSLGLPLGLIERNVRARKSQAKAADVLAPERPKRARGGPRSHAARSGKSHKA
jgi:probable rRNA maturation factor